MILECPSCHARYLVQIGLFAQGGRTVRCARCKNQWHFNLPTTVDVVAAAAPSPAEIFAAMQKDDAEESAPTVASAFSMPPDPTLAAPDQAPPVAAQLPALIKKWNYKKTLLRVLKVSAVLVLLLIWPVLGRESIVRVVPALRGVYEVFGLHIKRTGEGLIFENVKSELRYDAGAMRLYVEGAIRNMTGKIQLVPDMTAQALGADHGLIQSWWVDAPAPTIPPGEEIPFHTEINVTTDRTISDVYLEFHTKDEKPNAKP